MDFFHHYTIRKYTEALLDTFNDIYIQRLDPLGKKVYTNVPITFGSKDKAFIFSEIDKEQWLTGNYNILPRMSITLLTIVADQKRNTNRLHSINKTIDGKIVNFQYNAVAYDLEYQLDIATKSLTELSMVLEQILPFFNPTLNLSVMELDILDEPTSIRVALESTDLDLPDSFAADADLRIVGAKLRLKLNGNIYMPFKDTAIIEQVRLYLNRQDSTELLGVSPRKEKIEFNVKDKYYQKGTMYKLDFEEKETVSKNAPNFMYTYDNEGNVIRDSQNIPILSTDIFIDGLITVFGEDKIYYKLNFVDNDNEKDFIYVWNIVSGRAQVFQNNVNPALILFGPVLADNNDVILQAQVIDKDGNSSAIITKHIIIT